MSARRSLGGVFWGLALVGVGLVFLLNNIGYSIPIWSSLVRYWPVLIILWGVVKLVDYFRAAPGDRRLFSGGEVVLLAFLLLMGSAFSAAANSSFGFGNFSDLDFDFDLLDANQDFEYPEHLELDAPAGSRIQIVNAYGAVDIQPADTDRIIVDIQKVVRARDKAEADRLEPDFKFSILPSGGGFRIASNRASDDGRVEVRIGNGRRRYKSSMVVRVPKQAVLKVENRYGAVNMAGLTGDQVIETRYGAVAVRDITGALEVVNRYSSVDMENVSGSAKVTNRYGSVTAKRVGGVNVENRYGSIRAEDISGNAVFVNRYSSVSAQNVSGEVRVDGRNNGVELEGVQGGAVIETSYRNVSLRDVSGQVRVNNRHGDITFATDRPPQHDLTFDGEYSKVQIELPSTSSFRVEGEAASSQVESAFDGIQITSSTRGRRQTSISGSVGQGGPTIRIRTRQSDVRLQRRG